MAGTQSITQARKRQHYEVKYKAISLCVELESLERQSHISIVHTTLWTELMVHFIDCVCCNLSILTRPIAAKCLGCSMGLSPAICWRWPKHHESIHKLLPQPFRIYTEQRRDRKKHRDNWYKTCLKFNYLCWRLTIESGLFFICETL